MTTLVVATGATHHYFGNDQWEPLAPGLKTIENATEIRSRLLLAFERAEREPNPEERRAWLNFVIVGGGPTGVELAGALGEIANDTLRHDFRHINPREASILLVEGEPRVLPSFPPDLSEKAERQLIALGVRTRDQRARDADRCRRRDGHDERRGRSTWRRTRCCGRRACARRGWARCWRNAPGATLDRAGRVTVQPDISIAGHPEIFVIGDLSVLRIRAASRCRAWRRWPCSRAATWRG